MKTLAWFAVGGAAVILSLTGLEARTWTSASDPSKTLEGELISSDGTNIEIKLANGQTIKPALSAFSKADQDFVAAQAKPDAAPAPTAAAQATPPKPGDLEPVKLEIWQLRLCCSKAERMYEEALGSVEGVTMEWGKNNQDAKIIVFDAKTKIAAKEALAKIVEAGLWGGTTSSEIKIAAPGSKAKGDMTATGVVYCCSKSADALEDAMKRARGEVDGEKGVTEHTIKKSSDTFEIKGTATASEILRHAHDAGFHFTLEPTAPKPE